MNECNEISRHFSKTILNSTKYPIVKIENIKMYTESIFSKTKRNPFEMHIPLLKNSSSEVDNHQKDDLEQAKILSVDIESINRTSERKKTLHKYPIPPIKEV